jgi:hypothetical protein
METQTTYCDRRTRLCAEARLGKADPDEVYKMQPTYEDGQDDDETLRLWFEWIPEVRVGSVGPD